MARRYTPAERAAHVRAFHESGLTQLAFAAQIGVSTQTLRRWVLEPRPPSSSVGFIELKPSSSLALFTVELPSGTRVEVPPGFDASELRRLVAALGC